MSQELLEKKYNENSLLNNESSHLIKNTEKIISASFLIYRI